MNHWGILLCLQKFKINPSIINVMEHWFSIGSAQVRWNNALSEAVFLTAGVRQEGILSPLLFSAFIDVVLSELGSTNKGCFIKGACFNSFLYADDLLLLSNSLVDLQFLLSKCLVIFKELDIEINILKSSCLRVGPRFRSACKSMLVDNLPLPWVKEAVYLGVTLKSGPLFSCLWRTSRGAFYSCSNSLLGALGCNPNIGVILHLFRSNCIPKLTYGIEAVSLSPADLKSFAFAYNGFLPKSSRLKITRL